MQAKTKTLRVQGDVSVFEAEAYGVKETLSWISSTFPQPVVIETDSLLTVQALEDRQKNQLEVGNLLHYCQEMLHKRRDVSVHFIRKLANKAAHCLAHIPCMLNNYKKISSPPSILLETLMSDFPSF